MSKESEMEWLGEPWILELVGAALLGLWGWTAVRVVQVGENVIEVKADRHQGIDEAKPELRRDNAEHGKTVTGVKAVLEKVYKV